MARQLLPDPSSFIVDQVLSLSCSEDLQHLSLASGNRVTSRLVVLACPGSRWAGCGSPCSISSRPRIS
jgi:hypothetical protein